MRTQQDYSPGSIISFMEEEAQTHQPDVREDEEPRRVHRGRDEYITFRIRRSRFMAGALLIAFGLGLSMGYVAWGNGASSDNAQGFGQSSEDKTRYDIPIHDDDPTWGPEDAAITIIEFSDFECPYCRRHFFTVIPQLRAAYPDQIRYVFKDFPLTSLHPDAVSAAEAAHCAREQDAFWEFHDLLFEMRLELGAEAYMEYAADLELDMDTFSQCVQERRYADIVRADHDVATGLGLRSTPTFFINGLAVIGALPFEEFERIINAELDNLN